MSAPSQIDSLLVQRIRDGDTVAWNDLISRYEGRLLAFVESRLGRRAPSEDIVQETFIGFMNSLPNYDFKRPLEGYLFSICAHKLTDHLRREGRRPVLPLSDGSSDSREPWELTGPSRPASSIARSGERKQLETEALVQAIQQQIQHWMKQGNWKKLKCIESLFVRGWTNKDVATDLDISEQQVANFKFDFLARIRLIIKSQNLSQDIFPELQET